MNVLKKILIRKREINSLKYVEDKVNEVISKYAYYIAREFTYLEIRRDLIDELKRVDYDLLEVKRIYDYEDEFGYRIVINFCSKYSPEDRYNISIRLEV